MMYAEDAIEEMIKDAEDELETRTARYRLAVKYLSVIDDLRELGELGCKAEKLDETVDILLGIHPLIKL